MKLLDLVERDYLPLQYFNKKLLDPVSLVVRNDDLAFLQTKSIALLPRRVL
jgi:hypothetical protein